jgi:hypothetical protein
VVQEIRPAPDCKGNELGVIEKRTVPVASTVITLTLRGAQQRFSVDEITCAALLMALVDARVLRSGGTGHEQLSRPTR